MDKNKLKAIMILNGDNCEKLAKYLNISKNTLYRKLKQEKTEFTRNEIAEIKEKYNLTPNEIDNIFFNK